MPELTPARDDQIEAIYRESHKLWGSGLSSSDYLGLWGDLAACAWIRRCATFYVWTDGNGEILSSVKVYRPELGLAGRTARATVIGALFTPGARRRQGHASALVREVLRRGAERGDAVALLFTDIGTSFYAALGFRALPALEQWGSLPRKPVAPAGWTLRPMTEHDRARVRSAHADFCRERPLAILRDEDHWEFLGLRTQCFFERLGDPRLRQRQQVALDAGRFAGYLTTIEGRGEWNVREVGAPGGEPGAMAAILRLGAVQARRAGLRGFYGWLPPGVGARLSGWDIRDRSRERAVPMILSLDPSATLPRLETSDAAYLPFQDQF